MNKFLGEKIQLIKDAAASQKGMLWILEILVFVAVFIVCQIVMGIGMFPVMMVMMFRDTSYIEASLSGDMNAAMEASMGIMNNEFYTIFMLFLEILMIVVVCLFCKLLQKRKMYTLGFCKKGAIKEYLIGLLVGFIIFSIPVLIGVATGAMKIDGFNPSFSIGLFVAYLFGFVIQGMAEEVLCRGYFMVSYARRYSMVAAVIVNAVVFAALHLTNPGITVLSFVNLTLFGVFASLYFIRRGSIWGIGALHSIWNFAQGNFYGIQVSGMDGLNSLLSSTQIEGKELLNGGAFGMEGSILVTIVLCVGIAILFFWKSKKVDVVENV